MIQHRFALGPIHNICNMCGNDIKDVGIASKCVTPSGLPSAPVSDLRDKLIKAARERGRHAGIGHVTSLLEQEQIKAVEEDNKPLADFIWNFIRRTV